MPGAVVTDWTATLVERHNRPDSLVVQGRTSELRPLFDLTGGVSLDDGAGVRFSGRVVSLRRSGDRTCAVSFDSDLASLWGRIVYPTPSLAITAQTVDYGHVLSGPAETVALGFIAANAGPSALAARRILGLTVPLSLGRGGAVSLTARLDILGKLVADIADAAGLRIRVLQDGTALGVVVDPAPDLTSTARFGTDSAGGPGLLSPDWSWQIDEPDVTAATVAGGGQGTARVFRERLDSAASIAWGRRTETLIDQRQTSVLTELDKAGDDALLSGAKPVTISAPVLDSPSLRLGTDVPVGSLVSLDLDGDVITERLRTITTVIGSGRGVPSTQVTGLVGSSDAGLTRTQKEFLIMRDATRRLVGSL
jgi:Siphovirus ReqiPepy6 Gp37-like protein